MGEFRQQLTESRTAMAEVFRNPGLRRLDLAFAGSVIGDWAFSVATAVYAYSVGGATAVGVYGVARYLAMAILAPFASMLADRFDRRRVMVCADVVRVILVAVAALVVHSDGPAGVVYVFAIATGVGGSAFRPAEAALLPKLVSHPGELTAANVASRTIDGLGSFLGPAIGGFMLTVTDVAAVFAFNAATFVWSALLVIRLKVPTDGGTDLATVSEESGAEGSAESDAVAPGFLKDAAAGFRAIAHDGDLRTVVAVYCGQCLVAGASAVFLVALALDELDLGSGGLGILDTTVGVGGLFGGAVALMLSQRGKIARDFGIGVIGWAAPLLLIAAWPNLATALVAMVCIGLANSLVDVNVFTIMQRLVPDAVMGRVFGAMESAIIGAMALGSLSMSVLINTTNLRTGLAVIGLVVTLVTLAAGPRLRHIDSSSLVPEGLEVLRGVPMLGVLGDTTLERLARSSRRTTVAAGTPVFREGDEGDRFYVIESGTVEVTIRGSHIRALGTNDSFGEIALLRDIPRTATITASTDLALRSIDRNRFLPAVTGHGEASDQAERVVTRLIAIS